MKTKSILTISAVVLSLGLAGSSFAGSKYENYQDEKAATVGGQAPEMIHVGTHTNKYDRANHEKEVGFKALILPSVEQAAGPKNFRNES